MDFLAIPIPRVRIETIEAVLDSVIAAIRQKGVTQEELDRAKAALEARRVFEFDDHTALARRYGEGLAVGRSIEGIDALPSRIRSRSLDDIKRAAVRFLHPVRSVTGTLTRPQETAMRAGPALPAPKQ
jgi:zinc protease